MSILLGLNRAAQAAIGSTHPKFFLGAALYYKRTLLSTGANKSTTHPIMKERTYKETLHAEMQAILRAPSIPKGSIIYVYRFRKCGTPGMAKPCNICMEFIRKTGIKKVVYTDPLGKEGFAQLQL